MRYLITGGTGSFGRAFIDRLLTMDGVSEIRVFSRDEDKQWQMKQTIKDERVTYFIGDVRDVASIRAAASNCNCLFHAAAMKHVWSCEQHPEEAYRTNTIGTLNAINAAIDAGVHKFVLLSSDKAVYPVGAMGLSKAMAEKMLLAKSAVPGYTQLCAVRFGNLIDSRGNVIQVWKGQMQRGEPLTLREALATRFFMTTEDAMDTVVCAVVSGENGEIMTPQCKAASMTDLYSAFRDKYNYDKVVHSSLAPGEKLHEWLDEETCSENASKYTIGELMEMI